METREKLIAQLLKEYSELTAEQKKQCIEFCKQTMLCKPKGEKCKQLR